VRERSYLASLKECSYTHCKSTVKLFINNTDAYRYLDADSATGNMSSGQFCLDFLSRDAHDYISHEHLFLSVRSALPKIWGEQYPVSELVDDLENYRPLRLYHLCQGAKLELLRLARSTTRDGSEEASLKKLWGNVESFGDVRKPTKYENIANNYRNSPIFSSWPRKSPARAENA